MAVAVVFVVFACIQVNDLYWLRQRGEVVTGTVVDRVDGRSPSIEVRYTTRAGETVTEDTSNAYDMDKIRVGAQLDVIYDPEQPDRMQAADFSRSYGWPVIIFGVFSLAAAGGGLAMLRRARY
nr:DUF3592 domain-containing protein [Kribbella sandramycini]